MEQYFMNEDNQNVLLKATTISKQYPGVKALDNVNLEICKGEIHALVGENGAGKSTFVNVIGGVVKPDSGSIIFDGQPVQINNPKQATEIGIAIVHQELSLFPNLSIATNLYLSNLEEEGSLFVPDKKMEADTREILRRVGLEHLPSNKKVASLQPGEQQLVEIARSIVKNAKLIVLDEPTSSLADREIKS
jgi:ABC-type sugar transport system ATPase subunit